MAVVAIIEVDGIAAGVSLLHARFGGNFSAKSQASLTRSGNRRGWHHPGSTPALPRLAMTLVRLLCIATCLALLGLASAADAKPSNKWRIQCSSDADSSGVVTLRMTPKGAEAIEVRIAIAKNTGENKVARTIRDALKADERVIKRYKLEVDDGEDVLVKKDLTEPRFALEVISSTVKSVRLRLQKE